MRRVFLSAAAAGLVFSTPAAAAEAGRDFAFRGLYKCTLSGLVFAKIGIHAEQDSHAYAATSDIVSTGVINLFTRHSSHTTVDGSGSDYTYPKVDYETHYQTKHKKRYVSLTYRNGRLTEEKLIPPESPAKRPPVPLSMKERAIDPLTMLFQARTGVLAALRDGRKDFSLNVYDGRRLTEVDFTVAGKKVIRQYGRKVPVIKVTARRKLLAGFADSEREDYDPDEPSLHIYFSDDEKLFPVRLEVRLFFGLLTADLFKACNPQESCLLGNKD